MKLQPSTVNVHKELNNTLLTVHNESDAETLTLSEHQLHHMLESGKLAIIPIGFRCNTKRFIKEILKFSQFSLPFDSGFFPPSSVASILNNPVINLTYPDQQMNTHTVCVKHENYNDPDFGKGIKFQTSTYSEINASVTSIDMPNVNMYLDSTFGYYTADLQHNFVLAHYNWHKFADPAKSNGITDPQINIETINHSLNRRLERMFKLCNQAEHLFFIFHNRQNYNYMMIGDQRFDLNDLTPIKEAVKKTFPNQKSFVVSLSEVDSADKILNLL